MSLSTEIVYEHEATCFVNFNKNRNMETEVSFQGIYVLVRFGVNNVKVGGSDNMKLLVRSEQPIWRKKNAVRRHSLPGPQNFHSGPLQLYQQKSNQVSLTEP